MKRISALLLCFLMLFSLTVSLAGCKDEEVPPADYSGEKTDFVFTLDKKEFTANTIDLPVTNQDIAVFTRNYKLNGEETAFIGGDHTERTVLSVRYNRAYEEYTIIVLNDTAEDKADTLIPVNGFVISINPKLIEDLRVKEMQIIDVLGYDKSNYEPHDLASFIPTTSNYARRIYYVNPINKPTENVIYFINDKYDEATELTENMLAVTLELKAGSNYSVKEILESGTVAAGTTALIFMGKYNCQYAKTVLEEGKGIMLSKLENANSVCHDSAVTVNGETYAIGKANTNTAEIKDGIYMFDSANKAAATPKTDTDFIAIVVKDSTVVYAGAKNERLIIPTSSGYLLVFAGDKLSVGESYSVGDKVEELLLFPENTPETFVKINGYCYAFDKIDAEYENTATLYTHRFGETTGTKGNVIEISISDGKVVSVTQDKGNTEIPETGYVLSFPARGDEAKNAKNVKAGDDARVCLTKCEYSIVKADITGYNSIRYTDNLIVYNKENTFTNTNQYGYEIGVDKDGIMISCSNRGNMKVPADGYVLSGHGAMGTLLAENYIYGGRVECNKHTNQAVFYSSPLSRLTEINANLDAVKDKYSAAENALYDIDYDYVSKRLESCKELIEATEASVTDGDPVNAVNNLYELNLLLSDLEIAMITEKAVEERSVWYRSSVKSDADVLAVIEKCVKYNINAIYLETWYNGKTVGMTSNPLIQHYTDQHGDYDALDGFVRIGHEHGIQIHAWVENFFVGNDTQLVQDSQHVGNHNKDWLLLDKEGKNYYISAEYGNFIFLNPQNRECRDLILSIYREIIENYDIDGLHLDYIRYPEHNGYSDFGYNPDTIAAFKAQYGYTASPQTYEAGSKEQRDWIAFRQNVITTFVEEIYSLVKETRPELWLTTACYPSLTDAPNNIYQYTKQWVDAGYVDQVFSMTYSDGTEYVKENAQSFVTACKDKALYSTGLTLFSGNSGKELLSQITTVRDLGAGQALFSLSSLLDYAEYENILTDIVYKNKAASLFNIKAAIIAYANDLLTKCDGVYSTRTQGNEEVISNIKKLLTEIKTKAESGEYLTAAEQKALLEFTVEKIEDIMAQGEIATASLKAAIDREAGEMSYNLTVLLDRLTAKLS